MDNIEVLCVGLVCVDIIQVCNSYPREDSDQRCLECYIQRGGNASNNCTVLAQMGVPTEFFGTLSRGMFWEFVEKDFKKDKVKIDHCVVQDGWDFPLSTVLINSNNGSRTIVHSNRGYTELTLEDFKKLDLRRYTWIHFEGRNLPEVKKMMKYLKEDKGKHGRDYRVSVELEKPKKGLLELAPLADVVFIGMDFAVDNGWPNMAEAVEGVYEFAHHTGTVVCAWGEEGAMAKNSDRTMYSPSFPPQRGIVDTLGAGDTFCAAVIGALSRGWDTRQALEQGCRMAGAKVGIRGYRGLDVAYRSLLSEIQARQRDTIHV